MIQLPQADRTTIQRGISAANQLLVDEGDYTLVQALLNQGKTVRFRIKCDELTGISCEECICGIDEEFYSVFFDYLFRYLEYNVEPCIYLWAPRLRCIPPKGQIEVVVKPFLF